MKMKFFVLIIILFKALLLNSQEVKESILKIIETHSIEEVQDIILSNPDILTFKQFDNRNILFRIDNSKLDIFKVLLLNGANPNENDDAGWTPMTYNTSNYQLYQIYKKHGGVVVISNDYKTDYLAKLILDYTVGNQEKTYKIIKSILEDETIDINKTYDCGLTLSHLLTVAYLTYDKETNFERLIELLESKGMTFMNPLEGDFNDDNYPFNLVKGDNCSTLIDKITKHEFYNGRELGYIEKICNH